MKPTLTFKLVARSNNIEEAVLRLSNGIQEPKDITNVASLLSKSIKGSPAPRCLVQMSEAERLDLAKKLLQQTKLYFGEGDEFEGDSPSKAMPA